MPSSIVDAESLLAIDVGTVTTRASLFDVVEGCYRFIASSQAPTTAAAPFKDLKEGVHQAIENLEAITGRTFMADDATLIMPTQEGVGVDTFTASLSAGAAIKTVVVGLLEDVSLESTQRLARSIYARVVDTIGMNDTRKPEEQIDALLQLRPDLILMAGGTDSGATHSVQHLMQTIGLACYLIPAEKRPALLFAGNKELAREFKNTMKPLTSSLSISANLRPDLETENLQPAQRALADLYTQIRRSQMNGVDQLSEWSRNTLLPTAYAESRIVRFLSKVYDTSKGLLCVDLGASAANIVAAFGGETIMGVYPQLGLGEGLSNLLRYTTLEEITKWLPFDIPADTVRDMLYQKSIYPTSLPATAEDLAIEQAAARQILAVALSSVSKDFPPAHTFRAADGLTPYFEPILAAGSVITRAPTLGQSLLLLLDALQPVGITTVILDQYNLLPALGAAASRNTILPIQVLESPGAFLSLATVVAPYARVRPGTPILETRLVYQNGNESRLDIKQGALEVIPLPAGQTAVLHLAPLHRADIGLGPGKSRSEGITVNGSALGVVIDARGRPLHFMANVVRQREIIKKWISALGG